MASEMRNLIKLCLIVSASLSYCYIISSRIPNGVTRLLSLLPIICIFTLLPLLLSSVCLQLIVGLIVSWLTNFKLLLFALGPDDHTVTVTFVRFVLTSSLPIKMKQVHGKNKKTRNNLSSPLTFLVHLVLWCFTFEVYVKIKPYRIAVGPTWMIQCLFSLRMLLFLQLVYTFLGVIAQKILAHELEPQFNDPLLSSSVQDFWGKRWNRVNSSVLRSVIYTPTGSFFTPVAGRRWARSLAILATFTVSGLMHEMVYFYAAVRWPTWEVTWFFIINGVCVAIEIEVKQKASEFGWVVHPIVSRLLTFGFISTTGTWLSHAELVHSGADVREIQEFAALVDYLKNALHIQGLNSKWFS